MGIDQDSNKHLVSMVKGYTLHLDFMGTKYKMKNLDSQSYWKDIDNFRKLVADLAGACDIKKESVNHIQTDSLFVIVDDDEESLGKLIKFSRTLLEQGIEKSYPLRGSIVYGTPVEFSKSDPIIKKALQVEKMQEWIGVMVSLGDKISKEIEKDLITYPIPSKPECLIKLHRAIIWDVPNCDDLVKYLTSNGLCGVKGETTSLTHEFVPKATNTIIFGIWVDNCKRDNIDMSKYRGHIPVLLADMNLRPDKYVSESTSYRNPIKTSLMYIWRMIRYPFCRK